MEMTETSQHDVKDDGNAADFGDFVKNEDEQDDLEDEAEPWGNYDVNDAKHLFYPIYLGELLMQRYLIEHKLGHGGFSTVWMAHDLHHKKDVALKVMATGQIGENDFQMQDQILQTVEDPSHLLTYSATFLLPGPKSQHRVLVFPLMGPFLHSGFVQKEISMASRMSAAHQLLKAVEKLHQANIVHRDLNERNCMWGMSPLHHLTRTAKYEALGRPQKVTIPVVELFKKGELVRPVEVPSNLRTEEFYLGDFGLAMKHGDPVTQQGFPPFQFCSPERLHGQHSGFPCDMWSYMVLFSVLYLGYEPFLRGGVAHAMTECLGPFPEHWKGTYYHLLPEDSWYDQTLKPDPEKDLASKIARFQPDADPAERELVRSIMSKVFIYDPEKRLTATQLLHDPSFTALMEKYSA